MDHQVGRGQQIINVLVMKIWCLMDFSSLKKRIIAKNLTLQLLNVIQDYIHKYMNFQLMTPTTVEEHTLILGHINPN